MLAPTRATLAFAILEGLTDAEVACEVDVDDLLFDLLAVALFLAVGADVLALFEADEAGALEVAEDLGAAELTAEPSASVSDLSLCST